MFKRLHYVPLEPYQARYTYQLRTWSVRQFTKLCEDAKVRFNVFDVLTSTDTIKTGQVLDAFKRPLYAMRQIGQMLDYAEKGKFSSHDFILFEDMFHPGIESLFYAFSQMKYAGKYGQIPKIGMRCLAQTVDPDDFVYYTGMARWMRYYEAMVNSCINCLFVASKEQLAFMQVANWGVPTLVTGLPFNAEEVRSHKKNLAPFDMRSKKVVFASRIAEEKQPDFLGRVALAVAAESVDVDFVREFVVCSGSKIDMHTAKKRWPYFKKAVEKGALIIKDGLSKDAYYNELASARVLFNCSLQDWVSNTASEADVLGCNLVFPAYRSFPELFDNNEYRLYVPWSVKDAMDKIAMNMRRPICQGKISRKNDLTNFITFNFISAIMAGAQIGTVPRSGKSRINLLNTEGEEENV